MGTKVNDKVNELTEAIKQEVAPTPTGPRLVRLNHNNPEATLFYTTDGTYPLPNQSKRYEGPFHLHETAVVKCVALVGDEVSSVVTREYVVIK